MPRKYNTQADKLSRHIDHDDWSIKSQIFEQYNQSWGPYTIDRFASHYNTQCARFNSVVWCPGTEAIDAFSLTWTRDNNWLVPPPSLICRTINKLILDKAKATLIIPEWKSAPFWPLIHSQGYFASFIKQFDYLPGNRDIVKGAGKKWYFWGVATKIQVISFKN